VKTGSRKGEMLTAAGGWHSAGGWLLVVRVFRLVNLGCLLLSLTPSRKLMGATSISLSKQKENHFI
jgi:hypothetical protein